VARRNPVASSRHNRRHGPGSSAAQAKVEHLLQAALEAQKAGRAQRALELCEAALALDGRHVVALCAYASLATEAGRPEVAVDAGRRAAAVRPGHAQAHHCVGVALRQMGRTREAITSLGQAIAIEPDSVDSLFELCRAFLDVGDVPGAEPFLNRALDVDPNSAVAQTTLGRFYGGTGRLDDAIAAFRRAILVDPGETDAYNHLGSLLRDAGDLDGAIAAFEQALAIDPDRSDTWSNLLLTLQCSDRVCAAEVAARHREYGRHFASLLKPLPSPPIAVRPGRRLRVGYLSSGLRRHAVSKFFEPLIAAHDRGRFEIHCYYNHAVIDEVTRRIMERSEHFTSVLGMRDGHVAAKVRHDDIDILVDLDGHTAPNRLPVFFLRPAPVQATWVGYLATTGVAAIDYRITDARADPPGIAESLHVETLWRLPTTAWCYRPYDEAPPPAAPPFAANGFVTFVSLNNPGKVTRTVLELWARILGAVADSRLVLHISSQQTRLAEIEAFFAARDIPADRLLLVPRQSVDQYLALYNAADIALDTWPCAGGTTTCDALWMGTPVVTLASDASFSRTGASMLASLGLSELAAATPDAYVATAIALARDRARLAELRAGLRPRMLASSLTNGPQFAREFESALLGMWERHLARRDPTRR
jgi:protein O-GlcNAc transferase